MPPFQSRSTGSLQDRADDLLWAWRAAASMPSSARACGDSAISLASRGKTPPPLEISFAS